MVGIDPAQLEEKKRQHARVNLELQRTMHSTYQCTQCKRKYPGKFVRIKEARLAGGVATTVMVCPDKSCDAPVVLVVDALDLRRPPTEQKMNLRLTRLVPEGAQPCTTNHWQRWSERQFQASGINAEVRIGEQVQCDQCTQAWILCEDNLWRIVQ